MSVDLPNLDVSCKWNRGLCDLLCLKVYLALSFQGVARVLARVNTSFLFRLRETPACAETTFPLSFDGHVDNFQPLAIINNVPVDIHMHVVMRIAYF